jgi:hypothetical protein
MLEAGQRRDVVRQRSNPSEIRLLPRKKGEVKLVAHLRPRVGANDLDDLARQMEQQNRLRKLVGQMVKPLDYEPGSQFSAVNSQPEAPQAAQEGPAPAPECEISSVEYFMKHDHDKKRVEPLDFADRED